MSDYIKREDAIKASTPAFINAFSEWEDGWIESKNDTKDTIENLPLEDVVDAALFDRAMTLLKATYELLNKQVGSYYVLNILAETVFYDGTECDGSCLMGDIDGFFWEIDGKGLSDE